MRFMAIAWLSVLQSVPWTDVVRNAPKVAAGAKKLWQSAAGAVQPAPLDATEAGAEVVGEGAQDALGVLQSRMAVLESGLQQADQQLTEASRVMNILAEQNVQLIASMEALRVRLLRQAVAFWGLLLIAAACVSVWAIFWR